MADTYVVKKGDTLSHIAEKYKSTYGFASTYAYVNELAKINNLKNPNYIVVGQVIKLKGAADSAKSNTTSRARIDLFGLQSNSERTVFATWTWSKSNTKEYEVRWYYYNQGYWFLIQSTVTTDYSIYTAPDIATAVRFSVRPISETHKVNDKDTVYWTAGWAQERTYSFADNPPKTPGVPSVKIEKYTLTAELDNLAVNGDSIQFQIVKDNDKVYNTGVAKIVTNHASYSCTVPAGSKYKVRCRSMRDDLYSGWSDYSNEVNTPPSTPSKIEICRANSSTSVYLEWSSVDNAESYDIEYTTDKNYFDISNKTTLINAGELNKYEITGLTTGDEYFFRVRSVNAGGNSGWSDVSSTAIGKTPTSPTTWSSTTTAVVGEKLMLYWVHNTEDNSKETFAELELYVNGVKETYTIQNKDVDDEDDDQNKTGSYEIVTSDYVEGVKIQWRVRTAGVTKVYGDWSIQRTVDIYAPPTLGLNVTDVNGESIDVLESLPFVVTALAGPNTQVPIGYHLSIIANDTYETVDADGQTVTINAGDSVYSKYFDINDQLVARISADHISLSNNCRYTVSCLAHMDSGLNAQSTYPFSVSWTSEQYEPNAEISIDRNVYSASIRPFCRDEYGLVLSNVTLAVYRRAYDGSLIELASGIDNTKDTFITDPHPALDYARYRIVATDKVTSLVSYYDLPGYPVGGKDIIIQWDEAWSNFDAAGEDRLDQSIWSGSMLKLPYNVDVSDSYNPDVALVEYIGRGHPVSYYGTQRGETSSWNAEIERDDEETLYGLRRLANWTGDVYVREPSGSGYWASIKVSFSQKHKGLTIPVTLNVTRVEGGI